MSKLAINIKSVYQRLSKTEKKIADYLIENSGKLPHITITELGSLTETSPATIVRFAKKIGCQGYQEMIFLLAQEERQFVDKSLSEDDSFISIYSKLSEDIFYSLMRTKDSLSNNNLSGAYELLTSAKRIHLFGVGSSHSVCFDAYHKLSRLGLDVDTSADSHHQLIMACRCNEEDLIIAVSHSGKTIEIIDSVELAKEHGAKIISITSDLKSPLAKKSDIVLATTAEETNYRVLGLTSRFAQLAIFDTFYSYICMHNDKACALIDDIESSLLIKRKRSKN